MTTAVARRGRQDLSKYDPAKGLKTVAVAEAAEKYFARAKDARKLQQAIRGKLEAQAEFVLWWDTQVKKAEGGDKRSKHRSRSATVIAGRGGIPDRYVIDRWRQKLNDPEKFEATYESALARYIKILELEQGAHVGENTGETEWFTPAEYAERARQVLGAIDLDPASTAAANRIIQAAQFFTAKDNGLKQQWDGRVWMNPPYAQPLITLFCDKLAVSVRAGAVPAAIVLVNNATETQWFRTLADVASAICFPTGRVRFWHSSKDSATPLQGQAVLYIGDRREAFSEAFAGFGFLVMVSRHDPIAQIS